MNTSGEEPVHDRGSDERTCARLRPLRVVLRSAGIWSRNAVAFAVLSVIVNAPVLLYAGWRFGRGERWDSGTFVIVGGAFAFVAAGPMTYGVVRQLQGERAGLLDAVRVGLRLVVPVLGVWALTLLRLVLVLFPFAVLWVFVAESFQPSTQEAWEWTFNLILFPPVAYVFARLWLAVPVAAVERAGAAASLARSHDLSRGNLLRILVAMIFYFVLEEAVVWGVDAWQPEADSLVPLLVRTFLGFLVFVPLRAVACAVTYHDLRVAKEGVSVEELAQVFD